MRPSSGKAKGRRFQYQVCEAISEAIDIPYDQQDDQSLIRSREMGQKGDDVLLRGRARKRFPFSVECKNREKVNWWDSIKQASDRVVAHPKMDWVLFVKRNRHLPVVVMDMEAFFRLIKRRRKDG